MLEVTIFSYSMVSLSFERKIHNVATFKLSALLQLKTFYMLICRTPFHIIIVFSSYYKMSSV